MSEIKEEHQKRRAVMESVSTTYAFKPGDFVYDLETLVIGVLCEIITILGTGEIHVKVKFLGDDQGKIMTGEYKECRLDGLRKLSDKYVSTYLLPKEGLNMMAGNMNRMGAAQ